MGHSVPQDGLQGDVWAMQVCSAGLDTRLDLSTRTQRHQPHIVSPTLRYSMYSTIA